MLLKTVLPDIAAEITRGFLLEGRPDLAAQVDVMELVDRCRCGDDFCATFYTQPNQSWECRKVKRLILEMKGLFCLHCVDELVARVELLNRPDLRDRLRALLP